MKGEGQGTPSRGAGGFSALLHRTDLGLAALLLAFWAFLFYVTTTFEEVSNLFAQDIPPEFFPRLVLYFVAGLTLFLPFEHISHKRRGEDIDSERAKKIRPMPYYTGALLIAIVAIMPWLGTVLCMVATCVLLPILWGERRWQVILPFAILFPAAVTIVFNRMLLVYFEPGPLDLVRF